MNPYIPERRQITDRRNHAAPAGSMGANRMASDRVSAQASTHTMNAVDWISMVLLIIGGLNWGAVGLFGLDVIANVFGEGTAIARVIYTLVGLAALYSIYTASKMSRSST
jgi:hypothetical protein